MGITGKLMNFFTVSHSSTEPQIAMGKATSYAGESVTRKTHSAKCLFLDTWRNSEVRLQSDIAHIPYAKITKDQQISLVKQNSIFHSS